MSDYKSHGFIRDDQSVVALPEDFLKEIKTATLRYNEKFENLKLIVGFNDGDVVEFGWDSSARIQRDGRTVSPKTLARLAKYENHWVLTDRKPDAKQA